VIGGFNAPTRRFVPRTTTRAPALAVRLSRESRPIGSTRFETLSRHCHGGPAPRCSFKRSIDSTSSLELVHA
jgi:hypothetical protein